MKDPKDITCCVVDHGLFLGLAHELAKSYKRVLYHTPWEKGFPQLQDCCLGDGFEDVERCDDFWSVKQDIDLFVFPDIQHGGLQLELEAQGFPVWGSRKGDGIEINRSQFHRMLAGLGLNVPKVQTVTGITALRAHLKEQEDKYIKVSKYRGNFETAHWRDWKTDNGVLDVWAVEFGPLKEVIPFLVVDSIETDIEVGGDTFCVDGKFPKLMLQGFEWKDKGYFGHIMPAKEMPPQILEVNEAFAGYLFASRYRNFRSTELRIKDDEAWFIDPCHRMSSPGGATQSKLYKNLGEIIWAGAHGDLVEPEPRAKFAAECALTGKCEKGSWFSAEFRPEFRGKLCLRGGCELDGVQVIPPNEHYDGEIGWLCAMGDTMEGTIDEMLSLAKELPDGVSANTESLVHLLNEIKQAEKHDLPFADQKIPEPETALEV